MLTWSMTVGAQKCVTTLVTSRARTEPCILLLTPGTIECHGAMHMGSEISATRLSARKLRVHRKREMLRWGSFRRTVR